MVIGSGMVGKAFRKYEDRNDIIIFCSGVSNSKEISSEEFDREMNLLNKFIGEYKKFIYFSTISVIDGSPISPYIEHKLKIEKLISEHHPDFLIFRLPIVLGFNSNNVTFFNYIKNKIIQGEKISIQNVYRYLIDMDDVENIVSSIIDDKKEKNKIINICFENFNKVSELVSMMEATLGKTVEKIFEGNSPNHKVDSNYVSENFSHLFYDNYTREIIKKYSVNNSIIHQHSLK